MLWIEDHYGPFYFIIGYWRIFTKHRIALFFLFILVSSLGKESALQRIFLASMLYSYTLSHHLHPIFTSNKVLQLFSFFWEYNHHYLLVGEAFWQNPLVIFNRTARSFALLLTIRNCLMFAFYFLFFVFQDCLYMLRTCKMHPHFARLY